jgi:malate dehydrogenase (oxaloacetate-decarboxylating)
MMIAAARALAATVSAEELNANYIVPSVFHPDVAKTVAAAVRDAAHAAGTAQAPSNPIGETGSFPAVQL